MKEQDWIEAGYKKYDCTHWKKHADYALQKCVEKRGTCWVKSACKERDLPTNITHSNMCNVVGSLVSYVERKHKEMQLCLSI